MKASPPRAGRGPAWALLAAALAPLSVACAPASPDDDGARPEASCAYVVEYDSRDYLGRQETDVPVAESLGTATRAACDDTPGDGDDGEGPAPMTAFALPGVDPAVAIAVAEDPGEYRLVVADNVEELPPELRKLTDRS
ncbi:DUF6281 family protein [Streptomyces sp. Go-475]|uniref:DUF6281 family protein n=1 Tax=Streptomyces sp. Go-475 TaxID=2072505 RepID=UPI000DEF30B3|nr:DUF6281 family protein [Streptomyces sp. Go-475]AXE87817.1 hypothetical protein C1703_22715 [Streptomyces sp. Go-475]